MTYNVSDTLDRNGLKLASYNEVLNALTQVMTDLYAIDGDSIDFGSETPDGQLLNIFAQISSDNRELAREIYNSFNPENCQGTVQDQRYALNYITRDSGSYTIQDINITVSQTVTLQGLDGNADNENVGAYTVSDNAGNLWFLMDTTTIEYVAGSNTQTKTFRAQYKGEVRPTINTITNQTTKVLGVTAVNNPTTYTSLGSNEESDLQFKLRRNRSTATRGQNNYDAMLGQILELPSVTDARIHINNTANTDLTGTAPYSIWVIVEGGDNESIANIIYENSAGLATYATITNKVETTVQSVAGQDFNVTFNREASEDLYIQFTYKTSFTGTEFDNISQMIAGTMADTLTFSMGQVAETSSITENAAQAIAQNGGNGYALNVEISTGGTVTSTIVSSSTITSATTNVNLFQQQLGVNIASDNYVFTYNGTNWIYNGNPVNLSSYGITYSDEETPENTDTITVAYVSGTWTDYIEPTSMQYRFTVSSTNITINEAE